MTPHQFSQHYGPLWRELRSALDGIEDPLARKRAARAGGPPPAAVDAARLAQLYRMTCEHLALAQARAYPIGLTQDLQQLAYRAHRLIYRHQDYGLARLRRLVASDIPAAVRRQRGYLGVATLLFLVPVLLSGWAAYADPAFALHMLPARTLGEFRQMYSGEGHALGLRWQAESDWARFGFYVMHNVSLAFQCFAGGLFAGIGSVFFLLYNGLFLGVVAGYLTRFGYGTNFYSFVVTHSAFELTAICLSGAAGLRIGHAWLAPGRHTRLQALRLAAAEAVVLLYGVFGMLLVAAAFEAFWSGALWIAPAVKYATGALAWALVLLYLVRGGGRSRPHAANTGETTHAG